MTTDEKHDYAGCLFVKPDPELDRENFQAWAYVWRKEIVDALTRCAASNTVYIHYDDSGDGIPVYYTIGNVDMISVDDRYPHDRVFKLSKHAPPEGFVESLEGEKMGHSGDAKQKRVEAEFRGESHLKETPQPPEEV